MNSISYLAHRIEFHNEVQRTLSNAYDIYVKSAYADFFKELKGYDDADQRIGNSSELFADRMWLRVMNSESAVENGYHNGYHAARMIVDCHKIYTRLKHVGEQELGYHRRHLGHPFLLYTAALFHDLSHSGGRASDAANVRMAISSFENAVRVDNQLHGSKILAPSAVTEISRMIEVTQYPFVKEPTTWPQKILRDADMLQCLRPGFMEHTFFGLMQEFKLTNSEEFIERQIAFMTDVKFFCVGNEAFPELAELYLNSWNERIQQLSEDLIEYRHPKKMELKVTKLSSKDCIGTP